MTSKKLTSLLFDSAAQSEAEDTEADVRSDPPFFEEYPNAVDLDGKCEDGLGDANARVLDFDKRKHQIRAIVSCIIYQA
jgi:hypothetical protein